MISAAALYVAHAGSSHRSSGCHTCSWWRCSQRTCTATPGLDMKNRHTLDGLAVPNHQFCRALWRQVGSHVSLPWRSQQSFSSRAASSRPAGYTNPSLGMNISDATHQFLGRSISREVPFDQVGATCQVGGRHGSCGPWGGADTPSRPSRLHEPAHRPSGLVATPPAFQGFVDPSITGGFVWSR